MNTSFKLFVIAAMLFIVGCSSGDVAVNLSAEDRFNLAKSLFDQEDFLEAINQFTIITLQFQGSAFADDAQYYLAESRFRRGEYLLASFEYSMLKRNMPASPWVPESQYKLGLCYYHLSPKSSLDQQYTRKAVDELQSYVEYHPTHEHAADAEEKIQELTTKLAKKEYDTARLYTKMEDYRAAIIYYDYVIEKYHDTEYALLSYLGKVEVMIERSKYREALAEINKFLDLYPNSVLRVRGTKLKERIEAELKSAPAVSGKESGDRIRLGNETNMTSGNQPSR